jgi:fatty acyl-CoA reductase
LIRPSKKANADQRLNEIFISPIFAPLFKSNPEIASKIRKSVVAVAGDLMAPKLGISPDQRLELVRDLEIIINSAASVDFTEPIKRMIKIDYYGPISILELAHECKR